MLVLLYRLLVSFHKQNVSIISETSCAVTWGYLGVGLLHVYGPDVTESSDDETVERHIPQNRQWDSPVCNGLVVSNLDCSSSSKELVLTTRPSAHQPKRENFRLSLDTYYTVTTFCAITRSHKTTHISALVT